MGPGAFPKGSKQLQRSDSLNSRVLTKFLMKIHVHAWKSHTKGLAPASICKSAPCQVGKPEETRWFSCCGCSKVQELEPRVSVRPPGWCRAAARCACPQRPAPSETGAQRRQNEPGRIHITAWCLSGKYWPWNGNRACSLRKSLSFHSVCTQRQIIVKYVNLIIGLYLSETSADFCPYSSNYRKVLLNQNTKANFKHYCVGTNFHHIAPSKEMQIYTEGCTKVKKKWFRMKFWLDSMTWFCEIS